MLNLFQDDLRTKRKGRKRGSKKVKGRCYDHEEQERILEYRKEQERKSKVCFSCLLKIQTEEFQFKAYNRLISMHVDWNNNNT